MSDAMHSTYCSPFEKNSDLEQGDIVEPTDELLAEFEKWHPHFADPKYLAFIVLSQSCDLARRDGVCKAKYISLAVVRSIADVMSALLADYTLKPTLPDVYRASKRNDAILLLRRVINQNEQAIGLFYLHPDADIGIAEHAVAVLRVSIAVKSQHYDLLCSGRRGRLKTEFQMKLGWLVGNLYSRIATEDWPDGDATKLVQQLMKDYEDNDTLNPIWIEDKVARELAAKCPDSLTSREALFEARKAVKIPAPKEIVLDAVKRILTEVLPEVESTKKDRILMGLRNDQTFASAFR